MSRVCGTISFDNGCVSPHDGGLRILMYLDAVWCERLTQCVVLAPITIGGGEKHTSSHAVVSRVTGEPFCVEGQLRRRYTGTPPANASLVVMAEIQRLNDDAASPRWCWVESGVGCIPLCGDNTPLLGVPIRLPLRCQMADGLTCVTATIVFTSVELSGATVPRRQRGHLILPGLGRFATITSRDSIAAFKSRARSHIAACTAMQEALAATDGRTCGVRCLTFPGETLWGTGLSGCIPAGAAILGEAPYSDAAWWAEQVRQTLQRGRDTEPAGITTLEEWASATPRARAEFCAQLVANVIQLLPYMTDNADGNHRVDGVQWDRTKMQTIENFAPLLCEGSGDCEDVSRAIALLKRSLCKLALPPLPPGDAASPEATTLRILHYAKEFCGAYAAFLVLCSVNARNVKEGHAGGGDDAEAGIGAHMTLLWVYRGEFCGEAGASRFIETEYAKGLHLRVKPPTHTVTREDAPRWPRVLVTEGTGPLSTTLTAVCPPGVQTMQERITASAPQLTAPIVHRWYTRASSDAGRIPQKSPFFRDALDAHSADLLAEEGFLSFYVLRRERPGDDCTHGAHIDGMLAGTEDWVLLPWRPLDAALLAGTSEAVRLAPPPPPMVLDGVGGGVGDNKHHASTHYEAVEARLRGLVRNEDGFDAATTTAHMPVAFWVYLNDLTMQAEAALVAGVQRAVDETHPAALLVDVWPINAHLGCVHRVVFYYRAL